MLFIISTNIFAFSNFDISIVTSISVCLLFAWHIVFHPFIFNLCPYISGESPLCSMLLDFALLCNLTICLLIEAFSPFIFNTITEYLDLKLTYYYLISICPIYSFFSLFLPCFGLIKNFIVALALHQLLRHSFIILLMVTPEKLFSTGFHQRLHLNYLDIHCIY